MLVAGRVVMGLAQGVLTQAAPVYMAEAAPANRRAEFGAVFSLATSTGQVRVLLRSGTDAVSWHLAGGRGEKACSVCSGPLV